MIELLIALIPLFKAVHIFALIIWCGGLVTLPLMIAHHDPTDSGEDYRRIRQATHQAYIFCVTPAAVTTVVIGTWLIFLRGVFEPWFYGKLLFVALMVFAHAWIGHIIVEVAETKGRTRIPEPLITLMAILLPMAAVLFLVLAKPDLSGIELPEWLRETRDHPLPFEIPKR
ncbi:CopD family protein [Microbulbifer elongatus]|uniref:Protoporphyrinogen IX oxidase n=1 Tax=Microbulbifer elongatus TaxID=86173 RepID=A0ABT1P411_9GAMM|nr:CopD family protein [Microbulbifer elongatus]MCQ3829754.1 CopD family protein [Microbulbifer elongatus]